MLTTRSSDQLVWEAKRTFRLMAQVEAAEWAPKLIELGRMEARIAEPGFFGEV